MYPIIYIFVVRREQCTSYDSMIESTNDGDSSTHFCPFIIEMNKFPPIKIMTSVYFIEITHFRLFSLQSIHYHQVSRALLQSVLHSLLLTFNLGSSNNVQTIVEYYILNMFGH